MVLGWRVGGYEWFQREGEGLMSGPRRGVGRYEWFWGGDGVLMSRHRGEGRVLSVVRGSRRRGG